MYCNILAIERLSTTLNELKEMILAKEGLNGSEFGLQVINEHTAEGTSSDTLAELASVVQHS